MKKDSILLFIIFCFLNFLPFTSTAQGPWIKKANFPGNSKRLAATFTIGSKIYMGTGIDKASGPSKDFWEYDPSEDSWIKKADFTGPARFGAVGFSIGDKGYIAMGSDGTRELLNDLWEYDPESDSWDKKNSHEVGRVYAVGFAIGQKAYLGTGDIGQGEFSRDFWEYNPQTDTWVRLSDFPGEPRQLASAFNLSNKGYVGTGMGANGAKKDFWEFDPSQGSWTRKADFKGEARFGAIGFSISNKGYIGTGWNKSGLKDFWEYNIQKDQWVQKKNLEEVGRVNAFGVSINNRAFIGNGWASGNISGLLEYNPEPSSETNLKDQLTNIDLDNCEEFPECEIIEFNIFPNPTNSAFNLSFQIKSSTEINVKVLSEQGLIIYSEEATVTDGIYSNNIDLSDKPGGIYIMHLSTNTVNLFKKIILN